MLVRPSFAPYLRAWLEDAAAAATNLRSSLEEAPSGSDSASLARPGAGSAQNSALVRSEDALQATACLTASL